MKIDQKMEQCNLFDRIFLMTNVNPDNLQPDRNKVRTAGKRLDTPVSVRSAYATLHRTLVKTFKMYFKNKLVLSIKNVLIQRFTSTGMWLTHAHLADRRRSPGRKRWRRREETPAVRFHAAP